MNIRSCNPLFRQTGLNSKDSSSPMRNLPATPEGKGPQEVARSAAPEEEEEEERKSQCLGKMERWLNVEKEGTLFKPSSLNTSKWSRASSDRKGILTQFKAPSCGLLSVTQDDFQGGWGTCSVFFFLLVMGWVNL